MTITFGELRPRPEQAEADDVAESIARHAALVPIGATRLDFAAIDWTKLQGEPETPAFEPVPSVAKATLTKASRRRWELARIARRNQSPETVMFRFLKAIGR